MAHKDPIPEYEHKLLEVSHTFTANATFELECLCLTTIRPSGHISRPSQVGFPIAAYALQVILRVPCCEVMGVNSTSEFHQLVIYSNKKLYWIYGYSYQKTESSFSQKLYHTNIGNRLKEAPPMSQVCSIHHDVL